MFSQLVDEVIEETKRGDKIKSIVRYANQIIQTIHSKNDFDRDQYEVRASNTVPDSVLVWPRPRNFRKMKTARVNGMQARTATFVSPGRDLGRIDWEYYYYADESYVFCADGISHIDIMYYGKPPLFTYFPKGKEPAKWCPEEDNGKGAWRFLDGAGKEHVRSVGTPDVEHWAKYRVTDWLLEEYGYVIHWGVINLLATATEMEELRRSSYAAFSEGVKDIIRDNACSSTND